MHGCLLFQSISESLFFFGKKCIHLSSENALKVTFDYVVCDFIFYESACFSPFRRLCIPVSLFSSDHSLVCGQWAVVGGNRKWGNLLSSTVPQ